ncbi:Ankyrin repeat and SAM domain-containing protein 3 [Hondaea fermentalgiana]|uniref:2-dehydropantoate 2-reductase n=1 Tax=Hondaea fermentalgiana TaxID=2315210 RepID=A0A2R5FZV5_9STRA|nr:Ankyrin repeat and SAM domain-containing protein 3 [Hondaea fermentalgiana]|eukprot:GBG23795.1 Ankyrin repeat and SAM domain-containing protein 3 [Hondaea fermentalgiana]
MTMVHFLIKRGAKLDMQDGSNTTALMHAAREGHIDIVQTLIHYGAKVDVREGSMLLFHVAVNVQRRSLFMMLGSLGTYFAARLAASENTAVTLVRRGGGASTSTHAGPARRVVRVDLPDGEAVETEVAQVLRGWERSAELDRDLWPFDLTLVTVKSKDTEKVGTQLAQAAAHGLLVPDKSVILSLQNGMGNADVLRSALDGYPGLRVYQGLTYLGASVVDDQYVRLNGSGRTCVGPAEDPVLRTFAERMERSCNRASPDQSQGSWERVEEAVVLSDDVASMVWTKLLANAVINPVTAMLRDKNECVARQGLRPLVTEACAEFERIMKHEKGVKLLLGEHASAADFVVHVARQTGRNTSSMLADVQSGRQTEIEAINGFLVRRAHQHGVLAPTLEGLYRIILGLEAGYAAR